MAGSLDEAFWSILVPQLAHTDDVVKFTIVAISHFFAHPVRIPQNVMVLSKPVSMEHLNALQWYARALAAYRRVDFQTFRSDLFAKTVMLVCLELQQNNVAAALQLLKVSLAMFAPLLTAGCTDMQSQNIRADSIVETVLPMFMRSAGMLLNTAGELQAWTGRSYTTTELIFWALCLTWGLWKDFYLFHRVDARFAWSKLSRTHAELQGTFLRAKDEVRAIRVADAVDLREADALRDFCELGLKWLDLITYTLEFRLESSSDILNTIVSNLSACKAHGKVMYPAAVKTTYFHHMAILPLSNMVAVFATETELRSQALALMEYSSIEWPSTQLHAILIPPEARVSGLHNSSVLEDHTLSSQLKQSQEDDGHEFEGISSRSGSYGSRAESTSSTSDDESKSIEDLAWSKHPERPMLLSGDMLRLYPGRRVVIPNTLEAKFFDLNNAAV